MATISSGAEFLAKAPKCKVKKVTLSEWGDGVDVFIRQMPSREWDRHQMQMQRQFEAKPGKDKDLSAINVRALLLVRVLCNENGERLFTDQQVRELEAIPAAAVEELFTEAQEFQGIKKKETDDAEKNSKDGQSDS